MNKKIFKLDAGFTLIELIVVIAITAVLAGVGTVTYTGYIKRANQASDQQNVANLIYATKLADYADPTLFGDSSTAIIGITDTGVTAAGASDSDKLASALEDSVGDLSNIKLQYDWNAVDGAVLDKAVSNLSSYTSEVNTSGLTASYAAEVADLWEDVLSWTEQIASWAEQNQAAGATIQPEGYYLYKAATYVTDNSNVASEWYTPTTFTATTGSGNIATAMARNYAFSSYVKANYSSISSDDIATLQSYAAAGLDSFYKLYTNSYTGNVATNAPLTDVSTLVTAAGKYITSGQAKVDALAYVGIMQTVSEVSGDSYTDSDYMDTMSNYASILAGVMNTTDYTGITTAAEALKEASNCVVITVTKTDGVLSFSTSPSEADLTDGQGASSSDTDDESDTSSDTTAVALTVTVNNSTGALVLKSTSVGDIVSNSLTLDTTETGYTVTIEAGSNTNEATVSGSYPTFTWAATQSAGEYSATISMELGSNSSGITVDNSTGTITVTQNASGTVSIYSSTKATTKRTITFTNTTE